MSTNIETLNGKIYVSTKMQNAPKGTPVSEGVKIEVKSMDEAKELTKVLDEAEKKLDAAAVDLAKGKKPEGVGEKLDVVSK